jgi:putative ABC transport system ATP-binding protein
MGHWCLSKTKERVIKMINKKKAVSRKNVLSENVEKKTVIKTEHLTKTFLLGNNEFAVLKGIDLEIQRGEFVSIMGQSGSGKSTLLYLLGALDRPTSGRIIINDQDISRLNDKQESIFHRRSVGFVFQFYNLIPNLNVEDNIMLPVLLDHQKWNDYTDSLSELLEAVGLEEKRKFTPRELSGGQQQRVAIARALIMDPEIVFADEPVGNLDSKSGESVMELLRDVNQRMNKTIVQVTHSTEYAQYGNRIINIKDGIIHTD